ncbi:hypothetical protein XOO4746 [Xanthomonas oryzae pv. oryzae KACC 10331]|uniref:Uncharacterized protein n=1 Tax=Xanthomonas oryzae pv. oryzae (strain KACC10331 / KXO85) TaxID=291331 RepID=Q05HN8_XANOR|nr:hypothetical protein XOO4746 [Xanthomonas oryzae pv. oryzae KACC 10331]
MSDIIKQAMYALILSAPSTAAAGAFFWQPASSAARAIAAVSGA